MEENMMTIENENIIDIGEPIEGDFEFSEKPNYGVIGALCLLGLGGLAAFVIKNKHKFVMRSEKHKVEDLRKRGYEVYKIEDLKASVESDSEVEETEE